MTVVPLSGFTLTVLDSQQNQKANGFVQIVEVTSLQPKDPISNNNIKTLK